MKPDYKTLVALLRKYKLDALESALERCISEECEALLMKPRSCGSEGPT